MKEEERLTLQEAAGELGISEVTARRWVKSGKLRAFQPGRRYLIPRSAVEGLLRPAEGPPSLDATDDEFDRMVSEADDGQLGEIKHELSEHLPGGGPKPPRPTSRQLLAMHRCILIYQEQERRAAAGKEHLQERLAAVTA